QRLINPQQRLTVQPKLMLGDVNTPSERQADQISNEVMGNGQATTAPTPVSGATMPVAPETESAINQAKGGGQPLPQNTQAQMSQALGTDLSGVRVHTDRRADSLNQSLQAKAFTTGQNIFFRQGEYNPSSSAGQNLIAHELTHTVQQSKPIVQREIYRGSKFTVNNKINPQVAYKKLIDLDIPHHLANTLTKYYGYHKINSISLTELIREAKHMINRKHMIIREAESEAARLRQDNDVATVPYALESEAARLSQDNDVVAVPYVLESEEKRPSQDDMEYAFESEEKQRLNNDVAEQYALEWEEKPNVMRSDEYDGTTEFKTVRYSTYEPLFEEEPQQKRIKNPSLYSRIDLRTYVSTKEVRRDGVDPYYSNLPPLLEEIKKYPELSYFSRFEKWGKLNDLAAITAYSEERPYKAMNASLRGLNRQVNKTVLTAASGLNQLPPVYGTVYRGTHFGIEEADNYHYFDIGNIRKEKAFFSTRIDRKAWINKFSSNKVVFQVESKGGAKDIRHVSGAKGEEEFLFTPDTEFLIKGVFPLTDGLISNQHITTVPPEPTITSINDPAFNLDDWSAVIIYLEEKPSITQKSIFNELGTRYGAVNISKTQEIIDLLDAKDSTLQEWYGDTRFWNPLLSAIKKITTDTKLTEEVIDILKTSDINDLYKLSDRANMKQFLSRWRRYEIKVHDKEKYMEDAKKILYNWLPTRKEKYRSELMEESKLSLTESVSNAIAAILVMYKRNATPKSLEPVADIFIKFGYLRFNKIAVKMEPKVEELKLDIPYGWLISIAKKLSFKYGDLSEHKPELMEESKLPLTESVSNAIANIPAIENSPLTVSVSNTIATKMKFVKNATPKSLEPVANIFIKYHNLPSREIERKMEPFLIQLDIPLRFGKAIANRLKKEHASDLT
ncbi:MAG: DUF4157 domain-containing protein, partial [Aestuariibacter sp.]|nr:DUF4157 domain-containing protein [Aestuariibacter sp.]